MARMLGLVQNAFGPVLAKMAASAWQTAACLRTLCLLDWFLKANTANHHRIR